MTDDTSDERVEDLTRIYQNAKDERPGDVHSVIQKVEETIAGLEKQIRAIEKRLELGPNLPHPLPDPGAQEREIARQLRVERDRYQDLRDSIRRETGF